MGTNYYLHKNPCPHCGRSQENVHIGKSSFGWCFSLHVEPAQDNFPHNLKDWQKLWDDPANKIFNEYGAEISSKEMMDIITNRMRFDKSNLRSFEVEKMLNKGTCVVGPRNLLRHTDKCCVGHGGRKTYDLLTGEFC